MAMWLSATMEPSHIQVVYHLRVHCKGERRGRCIRIRYMSYAFVSKIRKGNYSSFPIPQRRRRFAGSGVFAPQTPQPA